MNLDRYDREVLRHLATADGPVRTKVLTDLYRQAGVRNQQKAKSRIKDLEAAGLIENAAPWQWQYVINAQTELAEPR